MRALLLDTHALLWWLLDDPDLSSEAKSAIGDPTNAVYVSAASAWEVTTKHRNGRLSSADALATDFVGVVMKGRFLPLAVTMAHGVEAGGMTGAHKDPFDRMLMAQARMEGMELVSNEEIFAEYGVNRLW